jgi:hypothetical protein
MMLGISKNNKNNNKIDIGTMSVTTFNLTCFIALLILVHESLKKTDRPD